MHDPCQAHDHCTKRPSLAKQLRHDKALGQDVEPSAQLSGFWQKSFTGYQCYRNWECLRCNGVLIISKAHPVH